MATALITHADCLNHVTPAGHPESVARLEAVEAALAAPAFDALVRHAAPLAPESELLRCHPASYLERVRAAVPESGSVALDPDTHVSPGSWDAALRAVGGAALAVDLVLGAGVRNAFVAARPPGHHAERSRAMGFCLFGTAAIAAMRALDHHDLDRVAVLDFDVHHGNGTQDLLWEEGRVLFASSHQMPLYPGSGEAHERGAHGQIHNHPLAPGSGGAAMRRAWGEAILPAVEAFAPELVIVSAGFDAHRDDPLAGLMWEVADFGWLTGMICDLAGRVCAGRVVSVLEGGYDLAALGASAAEHVKTMMERHG